ncbi:MAG: hypothetical protein IKZ43_07975 [Acidaminococcaceae bacterium]|nr:hypothetical protein [Acidaminococcaceae bacterium]
MHQAEKYIRQIVEEISQPSYMQEFLKQGKDKRAIEDVAKKLKQFSENMSVLQPIAIKGFMVPSGSLMLYHFLAEELDAIEEMLRQEQQAKPVLHADHKEKLHKRKYSDKARKEWPDASAAKQAAEKAADVLPPEQREEMRKRVAIIRHRLKEMAENLLPQHIADQIEQRTDEKAAQEAFQQNGYLPLYVDEKTMGIVYNTLTMQLLLDRFNLVFEGVFEPVDHGAIQSIMANVLAPFWKQHAQSILFTMEEE